MPRFFVRKEQIDDTIVHIHGDDAHHIARSLRMAVGERITVCDMQRTEYLCELCSFDGEREVCARIISSQVMNTEPPFAAHLYQALPKGDKLDTVIQKAVECGVASVTPFESERCVVRCKPEQEEKRTERRRRIAAEAAKQCGRGCIPEVLPTCDFDQMLRRAAAVDLPIFCYEGDDTVPLRTLLRPHLAQLQGSTPSVSVVIGSEGGFSQREAALAREMGFLMAGLGQRILRTETASSFVLSALVYELEL
ncbi:MAG: 16S rRNA (uracil(1498)-N(3))-methyltransferase [Clostridia bacterium]|nr:16S rRNA (uracil(1498)-N(3))-methyltransferase [Clostridia bacterium]